MSLATIHPDHLLDGARRRTLTPDEWRRLGAHLAGCRACAWEQAATDDFAREVSVPVDPAHLDDLLDGALSRAGYAEPTRPRRGTRSAPTPTRLGPWLGAAAMVAAAMFALLLPGARGARDASHDDPPAVASESGLDAGALGTPAGGDS
jgi:anti-sigma factor RsiW